MLRRTKWVFVLATMLVLSISISGLATPSSDRTWPEPNGNAKGNPHLEKDDLSSSQMQSTSIHQDEEDCDGDSTGTSDTGHGANDGDTYDNTCYDGPSRNGNGSGDATGKPCAGCVGQADDKNPKGQQPKPAGSDSNNGYECDGNNGIAKTNPAHTGCKTDTRPPSGCVENCGPPPGCVENCEPPPGCVENCGPPPPPPPPPNNPRSTQVLGTQFTRAAGAQALPAQALPTTGSSSGILILMALGMIGFGAAIATNRKKLVLDH